MSTSYLDKTGLAYYHNQIKSKLAMRVTITYDSTEDAYSADKTFAQIYAHVVTNGGFAYAMHNDRPYGLHGVSKYAVYFSAASFYDDDAYIGEYIISISSDNEVTWEESNSFYICNYLRALEDVSMDGATAGSILVYNNSTGIWSATDPSSTPTSGSTTPITSGGVYTALSGYVPKSYNGKYYGYIDYCSDGLEVSINESTGLYLEDGETRLFSRGVSNPEILLYNGTATITGVVTPTSDTMAANKKYVDDAIGAISVPDDVSDLTDVSTSSPTDGQVLTYDSTNSVWTNEDLPTEVVIVKITSSNGTYTADKTYSELRAANVAGKTILLRYLMYTWHLLYGPIVSTGTATFVFGILSGLGARGASYYWTLSSSDVLTKVDFTHDSDTTYTLSISSNVITLTPSSGSAQSITLPVYDGSVT